jgi:Kef-type K+ transport system membrane component KefB
VDELASSFNGPMLIMSGLAVLLLVAAFAFAVLVVMAALGLTSFSILERFRRRRGREDHRGGGIDDLF